MKVMIVLPCLDIGGAEKMATDLAVALRRCQSAEVLVTSLADSLPYLPDLLRSSGVAVEQLGKRSGLDIRMVRRLNQVVKRFQPDVIHTHQGALPYVLPVLMLNPSVKCVHTVHNLPQYETDPIGGFIHRMAYRVCVTPVAVTGVIAEMFRSHYWLKDVAVINNGIDLSPYSSQTQRSAWRHDNGIPESTTTITCLAHFRPQKNHQLLLRAFASVASEYPDTMLLLVGDGPLRGPIEDFIASQKLGERVRLLGFRYDIPQILASSDIGVLSSNYEGMPLSVMQMMEAGVPVVATRVGGLPELVIDGEDGYLVPPSDAGELAAALKHLVSSERERTRLGSNGRRKAIANFGTDRMAEQYCRIYESVAPSAVMA